MKSKTEKKLDEEFEKLGIRVYVYHFRDFKDASHFNAITIVTSGDRNEDDIINDINECSRPGFYRYNHASHLLRGLTARSYGVAICDKRDQFNRARGRIIGKGRLLKQLKKKRGGNEN